VVAALAAASVGVVGLALAGCGGGDNEGNGSTDTTASAANTRLTPDQWSSYRAEQESFSATRKTAEKKIDTCPRSQTGTLDVFAKCVGPSLDELQTEAAMAGEVLKGFIGTVSGSCATALNDFTQYVTPFTASVEQLQQTLSDDNVSALANSTASLQTALQGGTQERETFERECAPL
jgi:hypothetical protein